MKLDPTPWARKRMTDADRLLVRMATPEDHTASVSWTNGWHVKILTARPTRNVGQSDNYFTFGGGFAAAMKDMHSKVAA